MVVILAHNIKLMHLKVIGLEQIQILVLHQFLVVQQKLLHFSQLRHQMEVNPMKDFALTQVVKQHLQMVYHLEVTMGFQMMNL